jgi:hypothetical protein
VPETPILGEADFPQHNPIGADIMGCFADVATPLLIIAAMVPILIGIRRQ